MSEQGLRKHFQLIHAFCLTEARDYSYKDPADITRNATMMTEAVLALKPDRPIDYFVLQSITNMGLIGSELKLGDHGFKFSSGIDYVVNFGNSPYIRKPYPLQGQYSYRVAVMLKAQDSHYNAGIEAAANHKSTECEAQRRGYKRVIVTKV